MIAGNEKENIHIPCKCSTSGVFFLTLREILQRWQLSMTKLRSYMRAKMSLYNRQFEKRENPFFIRSSMLWLWARYFCCYRLPSWWYFVIVDHRDCDRLQFYIMWKKTKQWEQSTCQWLPEGGNGSTCKGGGVAFCPEQSGNPHDSCAPQCIDGYTKRGLPLVSFSCCISFSIKLIE